MEKETIASNLSLAENVLLDASRKVLYDHASLTQVESSIGKDIKLRGDKILNDLIVSRIAAKSSFPILSEESISMPLTSDSGPTWIIDPLDGSFNFHRGLSYCGIAIALWDGYKPLLGAFYDLVHRELFMGSEAMGVKVNEHVNFVSETVLPGDAVLCTGFPLKSDLSEGTLKGFFTQVQHFKKIRMLGSAAASLALVAAGRADAYYERHIAIWDVAAGLALVKSAGGKFLMEKTSDPFRYHVFAASSKLQYEPDLKAISS